MLMPKKKKQKKQIEKEIEKCFFCERENPYGMKSFKIYGENVIACKKCRSSGNRRRFYLNAVRLESKRCMLS